MPWLKREDLAPDMSGYRPKLAAHEFRDFVVSREDGPLEGLINLIGIDSPGLTSATALAEHVGRLLADKDLDESGDTIGFSRSDDHAGFSAGTDVH